MPGSPTATLQGWATVAQLTPQWDHTYAASSCGFVGPWACYGASTGGTLLIAGTGSSAIADCLAQPNHMAGIRYGFTGVCHQMANRILHPANVTVDTCRGYPASHTFFGDYGIGAWPERNTCYPPGTIFAPGRHGAARTVSTGAVVIGSGSSPPSSPAGNQLARDSVYNVAANITVAAQEASEMATLATLAEKALGHPLDPTTLKILLDAQSVARREQEALVNLFDSGEITAADYLNRINALARAVMDNYRAFLGEKQFVAIFGEAGLHPEGLIDRDVFMKSAVRKT